MTGRQEERDRLDLAGFCRDIAALRRVAEEEGLSAELESAVEALRRGEPLRPHLTRLGLEYDGTRPSRQGPLATPPAQPPMNLPGIGGGHTAVGVYRCPAARCARREQPQPGDDLPMCRVYAQPLTFG
ncbi:hypothetical protein ACFUN8_25985 [Streptomyces sp. NPDC057307]|uniref:hypothetical protein n=1 Tax=Streptomyces sp. NPDC057307 TaxID=3346096 RepID=UPI00363AA205